MKCVCCARTSFKVRYGEGGGTGGGELERSEPSGARERSGVCVSE